LGEGPQYTWSGSPGLTSQGPFLSLDLLAPDDPPDLPALCPLPSAVQPELIPGLPPLAEAGTGLSSLS